MMVWDEGVGDPAPDAFARVSVVTSPFATTTSGLTPRVLRSDITGNGLGISPWVVGCGYAIRDSFREPSPGEFVGEVMVIRLSDGTAWHLPDGQLSPFGWRHPLAVSCDEVFVLVDEKPTPDSRNFNVARLRIDSLGPGDPPPL